MRLTRFPRRTRRFRHRRPKGYGRGHSPRICSGGEGLQASGQVRDVQPDRQPLGARGASRVPRTSQHRVLQESYAGRTTRCISRHERHFELGPCYDDYFGDAESAQVSETRRALVQKLLPPKDHLPPYPKKKNYQVGDWFAIPRRTKGFGLGLVARTKRGQCLGYSLARCAYRRHPCAGLSSKDAEFIELFGDYHIRIGYWPKLGELAGEQERLANAGVC
jgi:hypothetical protein